MNLRRILRHKIAATTQLSHQRSIVSGHNNTSPNCQCVHRFTAQADRQIVIVVHQIVAIEAESVFAVVVDD